MAVQLEFIDFIVPIEVIKQKYPGGWEQCLRDHEGLIGGRDWVEVEGDTAFKRGTPKGEIVGRDTFGAERKG